VQVHHREYEDTTWFHGIENAVWEAPCKATAGATLQLWPSIREVHNVLNGGKSNSFCRALSNSCKDLVSRDCPCSTCPYLVKATFGLGNPLTIYVGLWRVEASEYGVNKNCPLLHRKRDRPSNQFLGSHGSPPLKGHSMATEARPHCLPSHDSSL